MQNKDIPTEICILDISEDSVDETAIPRRGLSIHRKLSIKHVDIGELQEQIRNFISQIDHILDESPIQNRDFRLDQLEISAGITFESKGELRLALLAKGEIGGGLNAGLKFIFKRN